MVVLQVSAWEMELRPRPLVSGARTGTRTMSLGRGEVDKEKSTSVLRGDSVDGSSSATLTAPGSGELSPRISPVQGGGTSPFVPLTYRERVGEAIRPPGGSPRLDNSPPLGVETPKCCDAGREGTIARCPEVVVAVGRTTQDEGSHSTYE